MLNFLDDYPIHQTPEPTAHPATTDRNVYDRFFFDRFSDDGEWFFGIAMGLYPHRRILDCALSPVRRDRSQRSFFASRRAPNERTHRHERGAISPDRRGADASHPDRT